jgi:hypothetical protein
MRKERPSSKTMLEGEPNHKANRNQNNQRNGQREYSRTNSQSRKTETMAVSVTKLGETETTKNFKKKKM